MTFLACCFWSFWSLLVSWMLVCMVQGWHVLLSSCISIVVIFLKNTDLAQGSLTKLKSALAIVNSRARQTGLVKIVILVFIQASDCLRQTKLYSPCTHCLLHLEYFIDVTFSEEQLKWQWMSETELKCLFLKISVIWPYLAENHLLLDLTKELVIFNTASQGISFLYVLFI